MYWVVLIRVPEVSFYGNGAKLETCSLLVFTTMFLSTVHTTALDRNVNKMHIAEFCAVYSEHYTLYTVQCTPWLMFSDWW